MIIYLFDPNKSKLAYYLNQPGIELWQKPQDVGNMEVWDNLGRNPLERVEAIILEMSAIDSQVNYLLAQAILLQKPTLCLYKKSAPPRAFLTYLHKKNVPRCIQMKAYSENNLESMAHNFIRSVKPAVSLEEVPYIKFTLRITESIEKYLNWKSRNKKINKADLIREDIRNQMKEDAEYGKWLKKNQNQ